MDDQVSLVKYFADVSKLLTICYKLSLEKQDLLRKTQCHPKNQAQSQQKMPIVIESSDQFSNQVKLIDENLEEIQKRKQVKQNKINNLSKTRSGKHFFQRKIKTNSNKILQENETFRCCECDKKYFHLQSLKRHINQNHQIVKLKKSIEEQDG